MLTLVQKFAETTCTINGEDRPVSDCTHLVKSAAPFLIVIFLVGLGLFIWWISTLVHVIKHEDVDNRILWIVLHFVGLGILCAPVYHFAVKRPYDAKHKAGQGPVSPVSSTPTSPTLPTSE